MKDLSPQLAALLVKHGMQTAQRCGRGPTWNGKNIDLHNADNTAWVTHELAHFITSSMQSAPNWGMGTDPGGGGKSKCVLSKEVCAIDEDKALIGGVILLIHLKVTDDVINTHIKEYNIDCLNGKVDPIYNSLQPLFKRMTSLSRVERFINFNYS